MKYYKLIFIATLILLFAHGMGRCQSYHNYTSYHLFGVDTTATWNGVANDNAQDSTTFNTTAKYYEIITTTGADTIISRKLQLMRGGNDITVHVLVDSVSGGISSNVYFGNYRGAELGWNWTLMDSVIADAGTITYNVASVDLGKYEVLEIIGIKIEERIAGRLEYAIRIKHFRWRQ